MYSVYTYVFVYGMIYMLRLHICKLVFVLKGLAVPGSEAKVCGVVVLDLSGRLA